MNGWDMGPPNAKIVFVGEAPGQVEVRLKRPFSGPSGQLLTKLMQACGIERGECYITNVVKEQPVRNDISTFIKISSQKVTPTKKYEEYEKILYDEINGLKPNIIVAVGAVSLYALTRKIGIMKWRGSILEAFNHVKVIPIINPAAALRQDTLTPIIFLDLQRIKKEMSFPEIVRPKRNIMISPSYFDTISFLTHVKEEVKTIAFDIEVMHNEMSCISIAPNSENVMSIPFDSKHGDYFTVEQEMKVMKLISSILEDKEIRKVGQNLEFDSTHLFMRYGIRVRPMFDIMIAQGIAFPDFPKGLDFTTSIYTMEPYYKDDGKKWSKKSSTDRDFWIYNAKDSAVVLDIEPRVLNELHLQGNLLTYSEQLALIEPLSYMQIRGLRADVDGLVKAAKESEKKEEELTKEFHAMVGSPINVAGPKQLAKYFYGVKGIKPYYNRKTQTVTTDDTAMKRLAKKGILEARLVQQIRREAKLRGTYYEMKLDVDGRIRSSFNPIGTKTGRISSSKTIFDTGGNLQNLPPEMLRFILADDGCIFILIDLKQAENRIMAYIAPEDAMIMAFEKGIDLHKQTAALIFGKSMEEISDVAGTCPIGGGHYSERFWGKKSNHSFNYDLGYRQFALKFELPESEAKFVLERYHRAYPGVRLYHAWVRAKLHKDRTIENLFGRKRVFRGLVRDKMYKEAYAQIPQSTVADIINRRGINYIYYNQTQFGFVEILNQIHDALLLQISPEKVAWNNVAEALFKIKGSLETPLEWRGRTFTIPIDVKVGTSLDKKKMKEININEYETVGELARLLHDIYGELRATPNIPTMDGNFSDSGDFEEEMFSELE